MMHKKAQAALEYLFTYGWAFLAILITLGVLAYFGVFNFASLRGEECTFPPGMVCEDFVLGNDYALVCGDVNGDGSVSGADRVLVQSHIDGFTRLTYEQQLLGDVNGDSVLTNADTALYGVGGPYSCSDTTPASLRLVLNNVFGADLNVTSINASDARGNYIECGPREGPSLTWQDAPWDADTEFNLTCILSDNTYGDSQSYDTTLTINFTQRSHTYEHSVKGWVITTGQ